MTFLNTQLTKNMSSQLLRIHKKNNKTSFLNMQLIKSYDITITFMMS